MKLLLAIITIFALQTQIGFAQNVNDQITQQLNQDLDAFVSGISTNKSIMDSWDDLGCVESRHECREEAHDHGYDHSRANYSRHCAREDHHTPYACYGRY